MRDILKLLKSKLVKDIKEYNDGNSLISKLASEAILSKTNFDKLKNEIVENALLDMLNITLLIYSSYRASLDDDTIKKCFTDNLLINDNIVVEDYLVYETLSNSEKKIFEIVAIINYM